MAALHLMYYQLYIAVYLFVKNKLSLSPVNSAAPTDYRATEELLYYRVPQKKNYV